MLSKTRLIIILSILGVGLVALAITGFVMKKPSQQPGNQPTYYDKGSGETIVQSNNSQQGTDASLKNATIWPGFSTLIDRGLSPDQIQSIQTTIKKYALDQNQHFKEVSLAVASYHHALPQSVNDPNHTLTFDITVNRTDPYFVSVAYSDTQTCVTSLYKSDKRTLLIKQ